MRILSWALAGTRTLKARVAVANSVVIAGLAVAFFLYVPGRLEEQAIEALRERGETLASIAAYSVAPAVDFGFPTEAAEQVAALNSVPDVAYFVVVLRDGYVFIPHPDYPSDGIVPDHVLQVSSPVVVTEYLDGTEEAVVKGEVRIGMDRVAALVRVGEIQVQVGLILSLLALLGLLAAPVLGTFVAQPIREMAGVARRVGEGSMTERAPLTNLEEVDDLARAFNAMVDKVLEGQQELREANLFLEARVAARTRDLEVEVVERRRAEESSSLLAAAVEQSTEIHTLYDERGLVLYTNKAFEEVSGFTAREVKGKSGRGIWNTPEATTAWWDMWAKVKSGEAWKSRLTLKRSDGEPYHLMVTVSPVRAAGDVTRYVSVAYDVTKEFGLEEQLRQAQKMEAVGRLAGGVAHDFNNLLTAILGYTESLQLDIPEGTDAFEDLDEIRKAAERAASLTSQLLAFSRRQSLRLEPVEMVDAVNDMERMIGRLIGTHIRLRLDLPEEECWIKADRSQLTQILLNLAVNARDAMPVGGDLEIMVYTVPAAHDSYGSPPQDRVVIHVSDSGEGIPEEHLSRIFEPFFTTKDPGSGTGLGLSTVFGIVEQLGGVVQVESEMGEGTTFRMVFPAARPGRTAAAEAAFSPTEIEGTRVLLVDDEQPVRQLVRRMLEDDGFEVEEAPNGVEALGVFHRNTEGIDILLTDVIMPGMSGVELAKEAIAICPEVKVILMSGFTAEALDEWGEHGDSYQLIGKPFRRSELRRAFAASGAPLGAPM